MGLGAVLCLCFPDATAAGRPGLQTLSWEFKGRPARLYARWAHMGFINFRKKARKETC